MAPAAFRGCGCPVDTSAEGRSTDRAGRRDSGDIDACYILTHSDGDENGNKYIRFAHPGATEDNATYIVFTYISSENQIKTDDCLFDRQANIYLTTLYLNYSTPSKVKTEVYKRTTDIAFTFTTEGKGAYEASEFSEFKKSANTQLCNSIIFANTKLSSSGIKMPLSQLGFTSFK